MHDLTNDAVGIDDRLTIVGTTAAANVDDQAVAKRIGIHGHDFGDPHVDLCLAARLKHVAQTVILGFERVQALQASTC